MEAEAPDLDVYPLSSEEKLRARLNWTARDERKFRLKTTLHAQYRYIAYVAYREGAHLRRGIIHYGSLFVENIDTAIDRVFEDVYDAFGALLGRTGTVR